MLSLKGFASFFYIKKKQIRVGRKGASNEDGDARVGFR